MRRPEITVFREQAPERSRTGLLVGLIVAAGVLVLVLALVVLVAWREHESSMRRLERDPSYQYGQAVMQVLEDEPGTDDSAREQCGKGLAARPAVFAGYDIAKAIKGCIAAYNQLNT